MRPALLLVALSVLAPCWTALPAQADPVAAEASSERVQAAIAAYEVAKGEAGKPAQRRRTLLWLGEIDHADATAYLQQELQAAGDAPFAATVLEAIGKVPRPGLQPDLLATLHRPTASMAIRVAAARAVAQLGDRPLDHLIELAGATDEVARPAVRDAVVRALVESRIDRAVRALAPLLLAGPPPERLKLLRALEPVHGVPPVSAARIKLVQEGDLELAAVAWRQLAVEKHERARALTIDVLERLIDEPKPAVAAELIGGLVRVRDPDFYPVLLRCGNVSGDVVRKALRAAAPAVAEDKALVQWLVAKGLDDARPLARDAARLLLLEAPPEAVRPLVDRIRGEIRAGRKKALELAAGLHELLARDPTWTAELASLAAASDVEHRLVGLSLLLEIGSDAGVPTAQQCLDHRQWELRSLSYRYLARCRDVTSIPLLIGRYGREEGRLQQELDRALFVHTGVRCWSRKEWESWWQRHKVGFVLPHADTVRGGGTTAGGKTIAYHDIPVVSNRIAFLVDRSGSMKEPIGTDRKRTRLDEAKEQLVRVLEALPATTSVNVVVYETAVVPLWSELRPLDESNRKKALAAARAIAFGGGTNIFDAIEAAFADKSVDTIYLLTDGQPSAGRIQSVDAIVEEVRRWNRTRQIVIHGVSIGLDSALLKQLAQETGGSYKFVR